MCMCHVIVITLLLVSLLYIDEVIIMNITEYVPIHTKGVGGGVGGCNNCFMMWEASGIDLWGHLYSTRIVFRTCKA